MGIRKDQLWVVPVFCIGAGIATHIVYFAAHFLVWIVSYPDDGWVNVYDPLVFGGCFLAALLLGGLCFFRDMTRKELFVSVSIVALYDRPQLLPLPEMYGKNLTFKTGGVDGCDCDEIMQLIAEGKIDTTPLITHTFPFARIEEAYELFENRREGVIKVAISNE